MQPIWVEVMSLLDIELRLNSDLFSCFMLAAKFNV